jgi:hypothetical protein
LKWTVSERKKNDNSRIRTCAGDPNGFRGHRLNHSATLSMVATSHFILPLNLFTPSKAFGNHQASSPKKWWLKCWL